MSPGKPAPEELPLLEEGDLESPAQLPHAPLPPVADLLMPGEAEARHVVSQVGLWVSQSQRLCFAYLSVCLLQLA